MSRESRSIGTDPTQCAPSIARGTQELSLVDSREVEWRERGKAEAFYRPFFWIALSLVWLSTGRRAYRGFRTQKTGLLAPARPLAEAEPAGKLRL
jgi:hypothetical protein